MSDEKPMAFWTVGEFAAELERRIHIKIGEELMKDYATLVEVASDAIQQMAEAPGVDLETKCDDLEGLKDDIDNLLKRLDEEEGEDDG